MKILKSHNVKKTIEKDNHFKKMTNYYWCKNCLNMSIRPRISFNEIGHCNVSMDGRKKKLNWLERQKLLTKISMILKSKKGNYDCLVL